jgi:hypothetical protein
MCAAKHCRAHPRGAQDQREILDHDICSRPLPFILIDKKTESGAIQSGLEDPRVLPGLFSAYAKGKVDDGEDAVARKRHTCDVRRKEGDARNLAPAHGQLRYIGARGGEKAP